MEADPPPVLLTEQEGLDPAAIYPPAVPGEMETLVDVVLVGGLRVERSGFAGGRPHPMGGADAARRGPNRTDLSPGAGRKPLRC
jgi:hypothetical protein